MKVTSKDAARFWRKVDRRGPDECWLWTASKTKSGYGHLGLGLKVVRAHRLAMVIAGHEVPPHLSVCHKCDNPACVNPAHLFVGSMSDNIRDSVQKGRHAAVRKTACPYGHPLSGEAGRRRCLVCHRNRQREYTLSKRGV